MNMKALKFTATAIALSLAAAGAFGAEKSSASRTITNTSQHDVRVIQPAAELTYMLDGPTLTITETIVKPGERHVFDGPILSVRELVPGPQSSRYLQGD
jgi:hypothetical protein